MTGTDALLASLQAAALLVAGNALLLLWLWVRNRRDA